MAEHDSPEQVRMDKQAAAIKRLRADRDKMLRRIEFLETVVGASLVASEQDAERQPDRAVSDGSDIWRQAEILPGAVPLLGQGEWRERAQCLCCGAGMEAGRDALSCSRCSGQRTAAIKGVIERPMIPRCLNCGADKAPGGMIYLCTLCRRAHKAAQ